MRPAGARGLPETIPALAGRAETDIGVGQDTPRAESGRYSDVVSLGQRITFRHACHTPIAVFSPFCRMPWKV